MLKVMHYVSKMDRAGQETFIMNLFRNIDRSRIRFAFLCTDQSKGDYDEEIHALGGNIFYREPMTWNSPLKQLQGMMLLRRALREHPCDVFHIHTHHAMDAFLSALGAKAAGVKTVAVHSHNTSALHHLKAHRLFRRLLPLLRIRRFACSEAAGRWMFTKDNFRVLHNGLELNKLYFRPELRQQVRRQMGWEGKKIVGHVGRFNEQKNHRFLIEIFEKLHAKDPATHLVLVGKGELEEEIRALVTKKNLADAVSFLGIRSDVATLYQGMDLFLFPSLFEGLSVVLVEAQACDLACLISSTNSPETLITDRAVMNPLEKSAEHWAEKALGMIREDHVRQDNREQIRLAGYDICHLAAELTDVYIG